jgi:hypothetical protein
MLMRKRTIAIFATLATMLNACIDLDDAPTACSLNPSICEGADTSSDDATIDTGTDALVTDTRDAGSEASADTMDGAATDTHDGSVDADSSLPDSRVCSPGTYRCAGVSGNELQQCAPDGSAYTPAATCPSAATCSASSGICTACTPGTLSCSGQQLMKCDATGGGSTASGAACPTGTICDPKGSGQCDVCVENANFCVGTGLRHCAADGQSSSLLDTCATADLCGLSTGAAACLLPACAAGEKRCSGANVEVCNPGRTGWDVLEKCGVECTAATTTCVNVVQVTTGGASHACARLTNGTVRCWGANSTGQLGDGTKIDRGKPVAVAGVTTAVDVAAGFNHTCALLSDGAIKCWGANTKGQLGDGTTTDRLVPTSVTSVPAEAIRSLGLGNQASCAVTVGNNLYCWGNNATGLLADGSKTDRLTPRLSTYKIASAYLSVSHGCAISSEGGSVLCWGANVRGQLGNGSFDEALLASSNTAPVAAQLSVAYERACEASYFGQLWCWGSADGYLFGGVGATDKNVPTRIGTLTDVIAVGVGNYHQCYVTGTDGKVYCWGANNLGQVGDGTKVDRETAVLVAGIPGKPDQLSAGGAFSCVRIGGSVMCWGANSGGQIGDGTTVDAVTPTWVKW